MPAQALSTPKDAQCLACMPFPANENPSMIKEIKAYRLMHGLSQKKFAKFLGIDSDDDGSVGKR